MLDEAEAKMAFHEDRMENYKHSDKKEAMYHARNFKALEGVCKTLRWVLGDIHIDHPLD